MAAHVMPVLPVARHWAPPSWRGDVQAWLGILVLAQLVFWTVLPWLFARSLQVAQHLDLGFDPDRLLDVPDASFRGPF